MKYEFTQIEKKWQKFWEEYKTFKAEIDRNRPKFYCLDFFPYPSAEGLHVGHPEGYIASDIIARYKRMRGYNVLHPMGWDAFGLQAEQFAVKKGIHPKITVKNSVENFKRQLKSIGFSYDWDREINTTDTKYYKWTQWIFLQLYEKGLAYEAEVPVNWCPEIGAILANEEVPEQIEKGYTVERRPMRQWMLRITAYAERLLNDLALVDWPESTKEMQKNWIGRSEGAMVKFTPTPLSFGEGYGGEISIFTTRPDTLWGATYMVLAPEHPLVDEITTDDQKEAVRKYRDSIKSKSELERQQLEKEKTGVFTGGYAVNPVNNEKIPVWIADYVLMGYGTGAIMAVPGHDQRDWEFAKKYNLPIVEVVTPPPNPYPKEREVSNRDISKEAFAEDGISVNSGFITGLKTEDAKKKVIQWLEENNLGKKAVQYKLRDWLFSRQRYWGEPIPVIHLEDGTVKPLDEKELPLTLPDVESYKPTGTGESPLAGISDWVKTTDKDTGKPARRETNTMPQWAGSCWYYLRFLDPDNDKELVGKEKEKYWMPVDMYLGGAEHAVLHLLYARFWHKVLYDIGVVSSPEPFMKLYHQGMILGVDNEKMSKSRGNVINPDELISDYGADTLRMFEMFLGPLSAVKPWSTKGIEGIFRFLNRVWRIFVNEKGEINSAITDSPADAETERLINKTIKAVTEDIEDPEMKFNTAISELMIFTNEISGKKIFPKPVMEKFVLLLSPFAPHLAEELWSRLGHRDTIAFEKWPQYDASKIKTGFVTIVAQVNGKVRASFEIEIDTDENKLKELIKANDKIRKYLDGKEIVKEIVVKNKLVNIVVKP